MKWQTPLALVALLSYAPLGAVEVLSGDEKPAGCEKMADIRVGDLFDRHSRDIAYNGVIEEAKRLGASKVSVQLISHTHPKLGKSYTARGTAWKCGK